MEAFKSKLIILRKGGDITPSSEKAALYFLKKYQNNTDYTLLEPLLIHLCFALTRIERKETLLICPDDIFRSVEQSDNYEEAQKEIEQIEEIMCCQLPEGEKKFILLHFVNILQNNMRSE